MSKSSAEIERDVEDTRDHITETLDELRARTSPGQLLDEAVDYLRHSGGAEMMQNLGRSLRDNPMPLLLIGAGVAWTMATNGGPSGRSSRNGSARNGSARNGSGRVSDLGRRAASAGNAAAGTIDRTSSRIAGSASSATEAARHMAGQASARASSAGDTVSNAAQGLGEALGDAGDQARHAYHDARDTVGNYAGSAVDGAYRAGEAGYNSARDFGNSVSRLFKDQPLIAGALGFALGAALGGALPESAAEDQLMGETRDHLRDHAAAAATEQYEKGKTVVQKAADEVRHEADRQGLTPQKVGETAEGLGDKTKAVLEAGKDAAAKEAKSQNLGDFDTERGEAANDEKA